MENHDQLFLNDFQYDLPSRLIAQYPSDQRDQARLFVRGANGESSHHHFMDLPEILPAGALIIVNDSRVFASRLFGNLPTGGKIEIFLLSRPAEGRATALARPMRKLSVGTRVHFADGLSATVTERTTDLNSGHISLEFNAQGQDLMNWIDQYGTVPLPPYILRKNASSGQSLEDRERYQTVYADSVGSVAAPTAGLHFTPQLLEKLQAKGIRRESVTLHVGAGTFLPVKENDLSQHSMHEETYRVSTGLLANIRQAQSENRPIVAVGTTTFRCLESLFQTAQQRGISADDLADQWHRTSLFIRPQKAADRYVSLFADALITNFHQPGSTLMMLVSALVGWQNCRDHYDEAIAKEYRFFSYGDSNLFWLR